jgi:hypothetical protein
MSRSNTGCVASGAATPTRSLPGQPHIAPLRRTVQFTHIAADGILTTAGRRGERTPPIKHGGDALIGGVQSPRTATTDLQREAPSTTGGTVEGVSEVAPTLPTEAVAEWTLIRPGSGRTSPADVRHNPSRLSGPAPPDSGSGMEDTLRHPPVPACVVRGSVAVAEVAGSYLCAEHAIEAMDTDGRAPSEETTTARM